MQVSVHTGHLSLDNGAISPLRKFFDLASVLESSPILGAAYGDDMLEITAEQWPIAQELLIESNLLYRVTGVDAIWQNVKTSAVSIRLGLTKRTQVRANH